MISFLGEFSHYKLGFGLLALIGLLTLFWWIYHWTEYLIDSLRSRLYWRRRRKSLANRRAGHLLSDEMMSELNKRYYGGGKSHEVSSSPTAQRRAGH